MLRYGGADALPVGHMTASTPPALHVGRSAELTNVLARVEEALRGAGGCAVLCGEAGIGKTTLVAEVIQRLQGNDRTIVLVQCDEYRHLEPLGAFRHATGLPPAVVDLLAGVHSATDGTAPTSDGDAPTPDAYRIVQHIVDLLERVVLEQPMLLVVEDVPWIDPLTRLLLTSAARHLRNLPLALLLTSRLPAPPDTDAFLTGLAAGPIWRCELGPLDDPAVQAMVEGRTGCTPGEALQGLLAHAGGNPLHVGQLLDGLDTQGDLIVKDGVVDTTARGLPTSLATAVAARLAMETTEDRDLLHIAAMLGTGFVTADLVVATGTSAMHLLPQLMRLVRHGVLSADGDTIRFRHDMLRTVIYEEIPLDLRRRVHLDIGRALAAAGRPPISAARHLVIGAEAGDLDVVPWLRQAAADIAPVAPSTAVSLLEAVRRLLPADYPDRRAVDLALVEAKFWSFDNTDAAASARELLARGMPDADAAQLRTHLAYWDLFRGRSDEAVAGLEALLELPGLSDAQRVRVRGTTAFAIALTGHLDRAAQVAHAVLAEQPADPEGHGLAHCALIMAHCMRSESDEIVHHATAAARVLDGCQVQHPWQPFVAIGLAMVDRFDEALAILRTPRAAAESEGRLWELPSLAIVPLMVNFLNGRWDDALVDAEIIIDLSQEYNFGLHANWPWMIIAAVSHFRGDRANALHAARAAQVEEHTDNRVSVDWIAWIEAQLLEDDDPQQAFGILHLVWDGYVAAGATLQAFMGPDVVRLGLATGHETEATSVTERLEAIAARNPTATMRGIAMRCRGLVDNDAHLLLAASDVLRQSPRPLERARALEDASAAVARAGDRVHALALLREAIAVYEQLLARRELDRANVNLARLGGRSRRRTVARTGWESLTETEEAIVGQVVHGFSNAEIGQRLHMSRRTVETHLTHVYTKLGFSGRVQLASQAAGRRHPTGS